MGVKEILSTVAVENGLSIAGVTALVVMTLLEVSKIKINPWSAIFKWLGNKLNQDLKKEVDGLRTDLNKHIKDSTERDLRDSRMQILEFCNSCIRGVGHTREQFDFIMTQCDDYEKYIEKNDVKNGVITSAIKEIKRRYDIHIQDNSFLKEGGTHND